MEDYKKYYIGEIKKCLNDLKDKKTFYKQIPNLLTLFRIVSVFPLNLLYFMGNKAGLIILSMLVFLSDFFDGKIARKYNISSSFGADLDAISDKMLALGVCVPLMVVNPILVVNIILEMMIGMVNTTSKLKGYDPKTNYVGKVKTWFLSLMVFAGYLNNVIDVPSIISNTLFLGTACTQSIALGKYIESYKKSSNNSKKKVVLNSSDNEIDDIREKEMNELEYLKHERNRIVDENNKHIDENSKVRTKRLPRK